MFTPDDLRERMYEHLKPRNVLALDVTRFGADELGGFEQSAMICRAPAALTADPVQFWVSSVAQLDWWVGRGAGGSRSRYIKESLCRHLFESNFNEIVAQHLGITRPLRLPLHRGAGAFLGALQMAEEWDQVSALAAYTDELISFFWLTSG